MRVTRDGSSRRLAVLLFVNDQTFRTILGQNVSVSRAVELERFDSCQLMRIDISHKSQVARAMENQGVRPAHSVRKLAVALPGSLTKDIPHLREKTARVGTIARALAIFGVDRVVIYRDEPSAKGWQEAALIEKILRFQETPQYLRRHLFKLDPDLQYAGTLPPLRIPSHPDREEPTIGLVRDAIVLSKDGSGSRVEAGFRQLVSVRGEFRVNQRITVRLSRVGPDLQAEAVDARGLRIYWGFRVQREDASLSNIVGRMGQDLTLSTSREGADVRVVVADLREKWQASRKPLVLFGSPERGIEEILSDANSSVDKVADFNLNMVPGQSVETVRTEEALMISLSVLRLLEKN